MKTRVTLVFSTFLLWACVPDDPSDQAEAGDSSTSGDGDGDGDGDPMDPMTCNNPTVTVVVSDDAGGFLTNPSIQLCGPIVNDVAMGCIAADPDSEDGICSGGAGEWSLKVLHGPEGERNFGGQAFRFVIAGEDLDFSMPPVVIPEVFETTDLSAANGATDVNIDGVLSINVDPTEVVDPGFAALTWLGGVRVGAEHLRMNQIEGQDVLAAWTFAPFGSKTNESFAYTPTINDALGLDPGTAVKVYEMGKGSASVHEIAEGTVNGEGTGLDLTSVGEGGHELSMLFVVTAP